MYIASATLSALRKGSMEETQDRLMESWGGEGDIVATHADHLIVMTDDGLLRIGAIVELVDGALTIEEAKSEQVLAFRRAVRMMMEGKALDADTLHTCATALHVNP